MLLAELNISLSFARLVAAEEELGPLFALVERASAGQLRLGELAALFWHCSDHAASREDIFDAVAAAGLVQAAAPLRTLLSEILRGRDASPPASEPTGSAQPQATDEAGAAMGDTM